MIVPRSRLIAFVALIVVPAIGISASLTAFWLSAVAAMLGVFILGAVDARRGTKQLAAIQTVLPAKARWIQGRPAQLELIFESRLGRAVRLRTGLAFPAEIKPDEDEMTLLLPATPGRHHVVCPCVPLRRGLFSIEGCYYEFPSPWGLWDVRGRNIQPIEARVYPNLQTERKQVASLFLRTSRVGLRAVRQVGQGRDFEKLREYVPGDGYDTIHWKATARRGRPITKVFQVERTQEVYVIIDASRLSGRIQDAVDPASAGVTHLDRYINAALVLGLAAERQGDLFGLLTFSDHVLSFVRARNGKEHYDACREALYQLEPQPVSPDFEEVAAFIWKRLRRRALLVFMTDLDDPVLMKSFRNSVDLISRQHLVLVQMLQTGKVRPVFTNPDVAQVDDLYQDLAQHMAWHDLRQLGLALRQHGVTFSVPQREQFSAETISQYLRVKQRQMI
jgi:uncharacterized protein (DUF58 family)